MTGTGKLLRQKIRNHLPLILLAVAHLPFLVSYYIALWQKPHYQFFAFALAAFAWLAISRAGSVTGRHRRLRLVLIAADLLCLTAAVVLYSPWLVLVGACLLAVAVCVNLRDRDYNLSLGYLTLLPLLTVRPPRNMDLTMIQWLQSVTTRVASRLLHNFEYLHLREGNVLTFSGKRFLVEEACSGVQSLFTVLFLAALITSLNRRRLAHTLLVLGCGAFFAGVMNVLRVCSIAVAWQDYQTDLSSGWQHDLIGYLALIVAAGLVYSADALFSFFTDPVPDLRAGGLEGAVCNPLTAVWNYVFAVLPRPMRTSVLPAEHRPQPRWLTVAAGLLCLTAWAGQGFTFPTETPRLAAESLSSPELLDVAALPESVLGFQRISYGTQLRNEIQYGAAFTNLWQYAAPDVQALIACDHPFDAWHELSICYVNMGWEVQSSQRISGPDNWDARLVRLQKPDTGAYGTLIFSLFERAGEGLSPPASNRPMELLLDRVQSAGETSAVSMPVVYQAQVFAETPVPLTNDQVTRLTELHLKSRNQLRDRIVATASEDPAR